MNKRESYILSSILFTITFDPRNCVNPFKHATFQSRSIDSNEKEKGGSGSSSFRES